MILSDRFVRAQGACRALSTASLVRLITEIDDNGTIPPRGLASALPDLTPHHVRRATERARDLGLVRVRAGQGLSLTESGLHVAELYDAISRWARRFAYPAPTCDFAGRIRHTLALLSAPQVLSVLTKAQPASGHLPVSEEATRALAEVWTLLDQWLRVYEPTLPFADVELAA
ncbi:regulator [Streptomyces sp. NPDC087440]|uniref:regulator n=1 Tax=Streptomyces sp. NPDC087440 TaxID=3365790 RepID=UPI0038187A29